MSLAQGGNQYEVADEVFKSLIEERELLALALTFASMVFDEDSSKQWLERKVTMLEDIVRDTWFYQKILKDGLEEGRKDGLEEDERGAAPDLAYGNSGYHTGSVFLCFNLAQGLLIF